MIKSNPNIFKFQTFMDHALSIIKIRGNLTFITDFISSTEVIG